VLLAASLLALTQADWLAARAEAEAALEIFRALDDRPGVIASIRRLGVIRRFQGLYPEARPFLVESVALAQIEGDPWILRSSLADLGALETNEGDFAAALPLLEAALALSREHGNVIGLVECLGYLGIVATYLGKLEAADRYLQEAILVNQQLGDLDYLATLFDALAGLAGARANYERALRLIGAADELLGVIGTRQLPPIRQARRDRWLGAARGTLGGATVEAAMNLGRRMRLEEALAYAQSDATTD
jgi:tetratricopeptide (TPR) repeat protein